MVPQMERGETVDDEHRKSQGYARWTDRIDDFLSDYLREHTLWPVMIALLGHVVVVIAPLMLHCVRDGSVGAGIALAVFGALTGVIVWFGARRRHYAVAAMAAGSWIASIGIAWLSDAYGVY